MLFLRETPIDTILSMEKIIEAVEESLREMALGCGFDLPRRRIAIERLKGNSSVQSF